jgi:hypothetical protein
LEEAHRPAKAGTLWGSFHGRCRPKLAITLSRKDLAFGREQSGQVSIIRPELRSKRDCRARERVPFEATLTDEDRARLHQLIERQLATADVMHDAVSCQAQPLEPHGHGQRDANLQHKLGQITSGQVSGKKDEFGEQRPL